MRVATPADLEALVDVQQEGAVRGLGHIFPQDLHPFPRAELLARWRAEVEDPETEVYVWGDDSGLVVGFAASRGGELLHFGTKVSTWGSGLAEQVHDALLARMCRTTSPDVSQLRLRVFEENRRARRFYEKLGWTETEIRTMTSFPPHPVLVEYRRPLVTSDVSAGVPRPGVLS